LVQPLTPAHLRSTVESVSHKPSLKHGNATIELPDYFAALNRDFRYQLTVIGEFAQAIVAKEIHNNRFTIRTNKPRVKVSWQVTGIRQDAYPNAHRIQIEEDKPAEERGHYCIRSSSVSQKKRAAAGYNVLMEGKRLGAEAEQQSDIKTLLPWKLRAIMSPRSVPGIQECGLRLRSLKIVFEINDGGSLGLCSQKWDTMVQPAERPAATVCAGATAWALEADLSRLPQMCRGACRGRSS